MVSSTEQNLLYVPDDFPDDCREHVFKLFLNDCKGDDRYLQSLSLVSKQFLSITNTLKFSLKVYNQTIPFLFQLLQRFTNLTSIDFSCYKGDDLDALLSLISCFPLKLTSLNISNQYNIRAYGLTVLSQKITTLTSLTCSNIGSIRSTDLFFIADCFPLLEELDLSYPQEFKDDLNKFVSEVETLSLKLVKLQKINISNHYYINDQSLFYLFNNLKLLKQVTFPNSEDITFSGIASALRQRPTLTSLSFSPIHSFDNELPSNFIDSLVSLKGLTCLNLRIWHISDELLYSIAKEGLPLKRLVLENCVGYSYDGIHSLLSKSPCIQHLNLDVNFLNDDNFDKLSLFLGNLVSINLDYSESLTELTLLALVRNCHLLSEISMKGTFVGKMGLDLENYSSLTNFVVNPHMKMKSLYLSYNQWLTDKTIKLLASICPNLEVLDVSVCPYISQGIVEILRSCRKIKHLNLTSCPIVNLHGISELEVLKLNLTIIDDETLYVISKSCRGLLQLSLEECNVTEKGVKHVLENCTQLREISLKRCEKVAGDFDLWKKMVLSRPSLRKITVPSHFFRNHNMWKQLLDLGCVVC